MYTEASKSELLYEMKNNTTIIRVVLVLISVLGTLSCGSDWSKRIGGRYIYIEEGEEWNFIIGPFIDIPPNITFYAFDDDYIVATQVPLPLKKLKNASQSFSDIIFPEDKSSPFYYWVVIKNEQNIYGPLDEEGFRVINERYHIPERLKNRKRLYTKEQKIITDSIVRPTKAMVDSPLCTELINYIGWSAKKRRPNLYIITARGINNCHYSFWAYRQNDSFRIRMNLPENVLYGWLPLDCLSNNELWNKYYADTVTIDKLSSFLTTLYQYGIQDIDIKQHGFSVVIQSDSQQKQYYDFSSVL